MKEKSHPNKQDKQWTNFSTKRNKISCALQDFLPVDEEAEEKQRKRINSKIRGSGLAQITKEKSQSNKIIPSENAFPDTQHGKERLSTVIPRWKYPIPSELGSQASVGWVSRMVGDHIRIPSAVDLFFFLFFFFFFFFFFSFILFFFFFLNLFFHFSKISCTRDFFSFFFFLLLAISVLESAVWVGRFRQRWKLTYFQRNISKNSLIFLLCNQSGHVISKIGIPEKLSRKQCFDIPRLIFSLLSLLVILWNLNCWFFWKRKLFIDNYFSPN